MKNDNTGWIVAAVILGVLLLARCDSDYGNGGYYDDGYDCSQVGGAEWGSDC